MKLENNKPFPKHIIIPPILLGKITTLSNCELTEEEVGIYNLALDCMAKYILKSKIDLSSFFTLNVIFTENGSINFYEESTINCGLQLHMAIYRIDPLRKLRSKTIMLFIFIEELAHYFLRISDETIIKYRIAEIMRYAVPSFTLNLMKGLGLNGLQE